MKRTNHFFYPGLFFWLLALLAWWMAAMPWALAAAGMALVCFIIHIVQRQVLNMFGKNKNPENITTDTEMTFSPARQERPVPAATVQEEKPNKTIIASGVHFTGNLTGDGHLYIYGEVEGNVSAEDGLVKVMRHGQVKGNINCRELIIDGAIEGECTAENISIEDHGNVNGALCYAALTVKKGGIFTGTMSHRALSEPKTNVVGFNTENLVSATEPAALAIQAAGTADSKHS